MTLIYRDVETFEIVASETFESEADLLVAMREASHAGLVPERRF